jgi:hypothetical protein
MTISQIRTLRHMAVMGSVLTKLKPLGEIELTEANSTTTPTVPSMSGWYGPVMRALDSLAALPQDWDGQGAHAPDPRALGVVHVIGSIQRPMVPEPDVVPGAGGRIALLWNFRGRRLELHFTTPTELGVLRVAADGALLEEWGAPTPAFARRHLVWLLSGQDWD